MLIALDAMGGDHAPGPIVAGAVQAVASDPELHIDWPVAQPILSERDSGLPTLSAATADLPRYDGLFEVVK